MLLGLWVDAGEDGAGIGAVRSADHAIWQRVRQRPDDDVDYALTGIGTQRHGGRRDAVDERAKRRTDLDGIEDPLVVRHVGIKQRLQREADGRLGRIQGQVEIALYLLVRAGEIKDDAFAGLAYGELDVDVFGAGTVVVHDVGEGVLAVGNLGDATPHAQIGAADDFVEQHFQIGGAVAGQELLQALLAEACRRDLGVEVALALCRQAHVHSSNRKMSSCSLPSLYSRAIGMRRPSL